MFQLSIHIGPVHLDLIVGGVGTDEVYEEEGTEEGAEEEESLTGYPAYIFDLTCREVAFEELAEGWADDE